MTAEELGIFVRQMGVQEGGVDAFCKANGLRRRTVNRITSGQTVPEADTVRLIFTMLGKWAVRPPHLDLKTGRFIDPETSNALLARIAELEARNAELERMCDEKGRQTSTAKAANANRTKAHRDSKGAYRDSGNKDRERKPESANRSGSHRPPKEANPRPAKAARSGVAKPKAKPTNRKGKVHGPPNRKGVPALFRKPAAPPARRPKKRK